MNPNDPWGMAQGLHQATQQDPNLLQQVWNNPLGKVAAVGIADFAAKEILSRRQGASARRPRRHAVNRRGGLIIRPPSGTRSDNANSSAHGPARSLPLVGTFGL